MSTRIVMKCDGCDAEQSSEPVRRKFVSFDGKGYGFGQWREPDIQTAVEPTGWIWSDPYTSCTYCPKCWGEIERGEAA